MDDQVKKLIDEMSYEDMFRLWRNAPIGEPLLQGDSGKYFSEVMLRKREEAENAAHTTASKQNVPTTIMPDIVITANAPAAGRTDRVGDAMSETTKKSADFDRVNDSARCKNCEYFIPPTSGVYGNCRRVGSLSTAENSCHLFVLFKREEITEQDPPATTTPVNALVVAVRTILLDDHIFARLLDCAQLAGLSTDPNFAVSSETPTAICDFSDALVKARKAREG